MWDIYWTVRTKWISMIITATTFIFILISLLLFINKNLLFDVPDAINDEIILVKALPKKIEHLDRCLTILESVGESKSHSVANNGRCRWANLNESLLEALSVLKATQIAFVGDSRIRDIFSYLKSLLSGEPFDSRAIHYNLQYKSGEPRNILLNFYWTTKPDENVAPLIRQWLHNPESAPQVVVFGVGAHHIWQFGADGLSQFLDSIKERAKEFKRLSHQCTVIWMPILPVMRDHQLIPIAKQYGQRYAAVAEANGLPLWNAAYQVASTNLKLFRDHVHFDTPLLKMVTCQFLLAMNPHNCHHTRQLQHRDSPS